MTPSIDAEGPVTPAAGDPGTGDTGEPPDEMPRPTRLLQVAWRVVGGIAVLLLLILGAGVLLPGTWNAERSRVMEAPPDSIFPWIDTLQRWQVWSPWPGIEMVRSGPVRGEGATMAWDDPFSGAGAFRIEESRADTLLRYTVEVDGSIRTDGRFHLEAVDGGRTRVTWREEGDFGWNPLLSYAALTMERVQGRELEHGLARLDAVVRTGELPDSLRPPVPGRPPPPDPETPSPTSGR